MAQHNSLKDVDAKGLMSAINNTKRKVVSKPVRHFIKPSVLKFFEGATKETQDLKEKVSHFLCVCVCVCCFMCSETHASPGELLEMCRLSLAEVNRKSLSGRHIVIDKELCKAGKKKNPSP